MSTHFAYSEIQELFPMKTTKLVRFKKGDVLFRAGEKSRELYIIRSGKVKVNIHKEGKEISLVTLGKGSFVGEMSFISGMPRSATVIATEPVVANMITSEVLSNDILSINNWALSLAKVLVERIRRTTDRVGDYVLTQQNGEGRTPIFEHNGDSELFSLYSSHSSTGPARIYLKGYMSKDYLNNIKEKIRELKRKNYKEVILDFSDVIDIDKAGLNYLSELTQSSPFGDTTVLIENVQLIRNKILSIQGIRSIIATTPLPQRRVQQGEVIIRENEIENVMYIVKTGSFSVYNEISGERIVLQKVEPGGVIGEMTLLKGGKRSANVVADQTSIVYEVNISDFYRNLYHLPNWFLEVIKELVERLLRQYDIS
jgi:CRP-like cAMP-binding protein